MRRGDDSREGPSRSAGAGRLPLPHALALVLALIVLALLAFRQVASPDVGFHLRTGESILAGEGWPGNDTFSYTYNDHPYIDTSWGYQVVIALIHRSLGAPGLVLLGVALVATTFLLLILTARLAPTSPTALVLLVLAGGLASEMRFEVRPELVSYAFLALVLYLLHRHAEGRGSPLWLLPPVFLVWANTHGLFALGWVAIACFAVGLLVREAGNIDRRLLWTGLASAAVTVANPYGWRGALFPLTLATRLREQNVFGQSIGEFLSPFALGLSEQFPFFPRVPIFTYRTLAVVSALAVVPLLRKKRYWCVLLWMAFLPLSVSMVRNIPVFVVACLPGIVWGASAVGGWRRPPSLVRNRRAVAAVLLGAAAVSATVVGVRVCTDAYYVASRRVARSGWGWNALAVPAAAVDYLERARIPGRLLNHLNFGGYLIWARDEPVFIDGRLEVVGESFFRYYEGVLSSEREMEAAVARYGIGGIVFPYATNPRLLGRLSRDPRWRLAYVDHLAAVFARSESNVPGWRAEEIEHVDERSLPGLAGNARRGAAVRWIGGLLGKQRFPSEDHYVGLFHYYREEFERARARFARAIRDSEGAYFEIYNNLGAALYRTGRLEAARDCYRVVLAEDPGHRRARKRLAEIESGLGRSVLRSR